MAPVEVDSAPVSKSYNLLLISLKSISVEILGVSLNNRWKEWIQLFINEYYAFNEMHNQAKKFVTFIYYSLKKNRYCKYWANVWN